MRVSRSGRTGGFPSVGTVVRRNVWLILAPVVLALGAAFAFVANIAPTYTASATVLLSPAPGNPLTPESASGSALQMAVAMETEEQMIRTPAVREFAATQAGRTVPGPDEVLAVSVPSNTQMLNISFTAASPELAREGAEAFAEGYLAFRAERAEVQQGARIKSLREQVAATDGELRRALAEASGEGAGAAYATQEVQLLTDRLAQLSNSLSVAELVSTDPGTVINGAREPEKSDGLPNWVMYAAAAVLGLFVGLGLALVRVWRRDLLSDFDAGPTPDLPVFATVPRPTPGTSGQADLRAHEAYRQLRTAVIANAPRPCVLAVSAVGEGTSGEVALHLARVLGEAQFSVLVVWTEPPFGRQDQEGDLEGRPGLAEVVLDGLPVPDVVVDADGVLLVPPGEERGRTGDVTASPRFREVVADLHQRFDYVVLAAGTSGTADGDVVMLAADATLLLISPGSTSRALLDAALDRLEQVGVTPVGAVEVVAAQRTAARGRVRSR